VRALGAEPLAYGDPRVRELEADVVFDPIGADTFADSVEALAREGTLVTPGAVGNPTVSFSWRKNVAASREPAILRRVARRWNG
jgi:NADPH:quinone reductase-like Zn-dependent oxidoreductase